jgi:predicted RNase H-like nuclease (RuvC/YqgF family)
MVDFSQGVLAAVTDNDSAEARDALPETVSSLQTYLALPRQQHFSDKLFEAIHKELECTTGSVLAVQLATAETERRATCAPRAPIPKEVSMPTKKSEELVALRSVEFAQLEESNAQYAAANRKLQSTVDDLQKMCASVLNEVAQLQKLVQMRESEILQLRHALQPPSSVLKPVPCIPAQETLSSRAIFGCPIDAFALDLYSPAAAK